LHDERGDTQLHKNIFRLFVSVRGAVFFFRKTGMKTITAFHQGPRRRCIEIAILSLITTPHRPRPMRKLSITPFRYRTNFARPAAAFALD
jgi:hypothetical protein